VERNFVKNDNFAILQLSALKKDVKKT